MGARLSPVPEAAAEPRQAIELPATEVFALREAIARCGDAFAEFRAEGPGAAAPPWDAVVVTCATASQAVAAQEELSRRQGLGLFPKNCLLLALPDPKEGRAGSGGATLLALEHLARQWVTGEDGPAAGLFAGRRVLLIHSGGESQRLPAYAALGKIFAPLPVLLPQAVGAAIFDWLYCVASALPGQAGEVTLLSGDVLPVFNPQRLSAGDFAVRGLALPVPAATGEQFGVYVPGPGGRARRILQKPTRRELVAAGAVDAQGRVAVDTGIVTLALPTLEALLGAAGLAARGGKIVRRGSALLPPDGGGATAWDLYRDWLPSLGEERTLDRGASAVVRTLAAASQHITATVAQPREGVFVHLGSSRDFHQAIARDSLLRRLFPFTSQRESAIESGAEIGGAFVGRSLLGKQARLSRGALIDHCRVAGRLEVGEDAIASGLDVRSGEWLRVAPGRLCYQTALQPEGRRVTVVLGIDDNPKLALPEATCNSQTLQDWLRSRGVGGEELWPAETPQTLWEARLFVADDDDPDRRILTWIQELPSRGANGALERWRGPERYALRQLLDQADVAALARWRATLIGDVAAARVRADVLGNGDESFVSLFSGLTESQAQQALAELTTAAQSVAVTPNPLHRARYWRVLADLAAPDAGPEVASEALREHYQDLATAAVREAVSREAGSEAVLAGVARPGTVARVGSPVRIDFGGGWTDTPPFSLERGGAVLNAAVTLDGELPVWAEAEVLSEPRLVLESDDIGATLEVQSREEAAGYRNPADPFALLKACLVISGVLRADGQGPLNALAGGRGLRLRTFPRVPRGSGLGGSSVLGAAALRALGEVLGQPQDDALLSRQTLELEQVMTTGGGWQDQMGAIAPGLKLVSTESGLEQRPIVQPVPLTPAQLATFESHLVVAYTGHHRLAKNILRQVVMRYLGRDPLAMQALYQLRTVAEQLARAAAALDLELFGTLVNQAWLLNKTLDPQTSYPAIERLFSALAPHIYGAKLVGAGGGGFFFAVTRKPGQQDLVADIMARDREFAYGYVVRHEIWQGGLQVSSTIG
jgi:fucokinase